MPENFLGKSKNPTINMLDHMMFNLDQLQDKDYVKRLPKYLFKVQTNQFQTGRGTSNLLRRTQNTNRRQQFIH